MQDASTEFETAVAGHRTFVPPRLRTDWDGTGYAGDGTVDDLSGQMEAGWSVDHTLDDGYPDSVTFVSGTSVPELTAGLVGRSDPDTGAPITAAAYWSPLRTDSPVHGYDRDIAPVTLDVGLVTETGPDYARVFTGQMANTPVKQGRVELRTISQTRLKLMKAVQPPAFIRQYSLGLTSTWPVSFALTQCGLYAGPAPRTEGTAWYAPMHGGAWQHIPCGNMTRAAIDFALLSQYEQWVGRRRLPGDADYTMIYELDWITGPYLTAPDLEVTATERREMYQLDLTLSPSAPAPFTQESNAARLEMWVRGDATDINNTPGGSGSVTGLCRFVGQTTAGCSFRLGVHYDRTVIARVFDGTTTHTLQSAGTLPTDGAWHFVGAAYDMTAGRLWVNLDGNVSAANATMPTTSLPPSDDYQAWQSGAPQFVSGLPCAEITLTTGPQANVDDYPVWRSSADFAPTARVHPSRVELAAMVYTEPIEAWQLISNHARAELAAMRCDELDVFEYLPLGWWVHPEQQQVVDLFATDLNAAGFDIDLDPTKVRNSIQVSYTATSVPTFDVEAAQFRPIFEMDTQTQVAIPPGLTRVAVTFSDPGVALQQLIYILEVPANIPALDVGISYATLNSAVDGTGFYTSNPYVGSTIESWHAGGAVILFNNGTNATWYLANDENIPPLRLSGIPVTMTSMYTVDADTSAVSVARGERPLDVSAPVLQYETEARRLARNLKMALRKPVPTVGDDTAGVLVTGNPLRQPGDLGMFRDSVTGVQGGLWRVRGVKHAGSGAAYVQQVVARQTKPIGTWGSSTWGDCLWGPST